MNLLDAVIFLRENILDDVGGLDTDWACFSEDDDDSFQLRWTNEELTSNINEAINQVFRRILPIKEVNPLFSVTTVIGTQTYTLDPRILQVLGVRDSTTGKTLQEISLEDVWDNRTFETELKTPEFYITNLDTNSISFYKIPDEITTYTILTYRLPLLSLSWDKNTLDLELRDEYIIPMLWYAASLSYEKDEANILDPDRSVYFLQKFNQEFPPTSIYSDVRKRRTSNRSIRYGGL